MSKEFLCFQKMFFEQDKAPSSPRDDQFMTAMREVDHWHSWRVRGRELPVGIIASRVENQKIMINLPIKQKFRQQRGQIQTFRLRLHVGHTGCWESFPKADMKHPTLCWQLPIPVIPMPYVELQLLSEAAVQRLSAWLNVTTES